MSRESPAHHGQSILSVGARPPTPALPGHLPSWAVARLCLVALAAVATSSAGQRSLAGDARIVQIDGQSTVLRAPWKEERGSGGGAESLVNGSFDDGLTGWTTAEEGGDVAPGSVSVEGGAAVLREGDSFLVTLSREIEIPANAASLTFEIDLSPGLDTTFREGIPDAFEVSLLDGQGAPVTDAWSSAASSFFNLQESGATNLGAGVTWDGARVTLDLSGARSGPATLFVDLIGADLDDGSLVRFDAVALGTGSGEGFIRGNSNLDGTVNITDPIFTLNYLFLGTTEVTCLDAADADNDGKVNITDPIYVLGYLFLGSDPIPPPFPACGLDQGPEDGLGCAPCSCPGSDGGECP